MGNVLSLILSAVINLFVSSESLTGMPGSISYIPFWLMLASSAFAVLVGMAAGYFPAVRAMKLSPLAAIRGEKVVLLYYNDRQYNFFRFTYNYLEKHELYYASI